MFPLFFLWFRGRQVDRFMEFKSNFHKMTEEDMTQLYDDLKEQFKVRESDLLPECRELMLQWSDATCRTVLDVGCGRGHLLQAYAEQGYEVMGCDLVNNLDDRLVPFATGSMEEIPFPDRSFDIVVCSHTLEHVVNLAKAVAELKRVARRQILVCVPRQRYYYYTMDLHIQFFPTEAYLVAPFELANYRIAERGGDWVYMAMMPEKEEASG